jgi:hypothetical protein
VHFQRGVTPRYEPQNTPKYVRKNLASVTKKPVLKSEFLSTPFSREEGGGRGRGAPDIFVFLCSSTSLLGKLCKTSYITLLS